MQAKQKMVWSIVLVAAAFAASAGSVARAENNFGGLENRPNSGYFGVGATAGAGFGLRSANFAIAPGFHSITLAEFSTRVGARFATLPYSIGLGGGATLAYQSMSGSLGEGLNEFSGISYGPDLMAERRFGKISSFTSLGYRVGAYTGRGSVNWNSAESTPAFFLYGDAVNVEKTKKFQSSGFHVALGAGYDVVEHVTATVAADIGFEKMSSDTRVIDGRTDMPGRSHGDYGSQAIQFGAQIGL